MVKLSKLKVTANIKAVVYTGDGTTDRVVSLGFRPDIYWIWPRTNLEDHVRGADVEELTPSRIGVVGVDTKDHLTSDGVNVGYVHDFQGAGNKTGIKYVLIGISE